MVKAVEKSEAPPKVIASKTSGGSSKTSGGSGLAENAAKIATAARTATAQAAN